MVAVLLLRAATSSVTFETFDIAAVEWFVQGRDELVLGRKGKESLMVREVCFDRNLSAQTQLLCAESRRKVQENPVKSQFCEKSIR